MARPEEEWTEEDRKQVAEYEKKVKDLEEEREKYRKQLEVELKKLQAQIQDSTTSFDEALQQLFHKKIKTEMVIYQVSLNGWSMILFTMVNTITTVNFHLSQERESLSHELCCV